MLADSAPLATAATHAYARGMVRPVQRAPAP